MAEKQWFFFTSTAEVSTRPRSPLWHSKTDSAKINNNNNTGSVNSSTPRRKPRVCWVSRCLSISSRDSCFIFFYLLAHSFVFFSWLAVVVMVAYSDSLGFLGILQESYVGIDAFVCWFYVASALRSYCMYVFFLFFYYISPSRSQSVCRFFFCLWMCIYTI